MAIDDASPITEAYNYEESPVQVAEYAYGHLEGDGRLHGSDLEHWLAAEAGLLAERSI